MSKILSSEITSESIYHQRRHFIKKMGLGTLTTTLTGASSWAAENGHNLGNVKPIPTIKSVLSTTDKQTSYNDITSYNNYYEFGTDKSSPGNAAKTLITQPWTVKIEGLVKQPKTYDIETLFKLAPMEERIYRLRCVEGWSMVIPWIGYSLSRLIKEVSPLGSAKYVEFVTLADEKQMPSVIGNILSWPYREGLRLDEANHPLTLLTFGLYGNTLPQQNGAPLRIIVPWKYGFKSPKSIITIRFVETMPSTAWNRYAPSEYGFYSNVNPNVDHPRWSQATERRIGDSGFFSPKKKTLMFNGYDDVAHLYTGMDLKKFF